MDEPITVLHVDDDQAFLDLAATFLEREHESISVVTTTSVDEALDVLADGAVDCVVSDLEMPEMDGLEFLEAVRVEHPDLPFVLFTGKGSEAVASKAITAGVTDYLQKGDGTDQYVVLANRVENAVSQRRAERSLAENERRFRALIEQSSDVISVLSADGAYRYQSPSVETVLGHDPDAMLGEDAFQYIHPEDRDRVAETFAKAVAESEEGATAEYRFRHADDSWRVLESTGKNLLDDPAVGGVVVNSRDVTERKRADHELAEAKATIEALYDVAARMEDCTTADELYELAVESAEAILEFDLCIVDSVDDDVLVPRAISSGVPEEAYYDTTPIDEEDNLASETYRERESFVIGDLHAAGYVPAKSTYQSAISIPIGDRGIFQAVSETPHAFDDTDCDAAELLVAHLAASLERVERETILRMLQEDIDRIRRADDPDEICTIAVEAARDVLGVPLCGVHLLDDAGAVLEPTAVTAAVEALFDGSVPSYTAADPIVWDVFDDGESRVVPHVDEADQPNPETTVRTLAVFPLGDLGVMLLASETPDAFEVADVHFAKLLAAGTEATLIRAHRERELTEHEARLERERNRLTALFENATDSIVFAEFVDNEPIVIDANPAFEETFGYDADEIRGESVDELIVPPEGVDEAAEITSRGHRGEDFEVEVRRLAADGPRDFLLRSVPVETDGDSTTGYGVYTDITERAEREDELQRQNERLEEFASVVSHDLRNPLTVADGHLELAVETGEAVHHEKVAGALDRMGRIIDDLLALAREGRAVGETSTIDLAAVARRGWRSVDSGTATLAVGDGLGSVAADEGRLQGLFENLFRNAVEHGGEDVTVRVGTVANGFYVEDDGPGIPAEARDQPFEFGYSTAEEGTGFGLAIVRQIAEAHGWTVNVGVGVSGGARFEIRGVEFV
jgi:PAS domain S-box-containing protein